MEGKEYGISEQQPLNFALAKQGLPVNEQEAIE